MSAIISPSTKTPCPPNMGRTETGANSRKRSRSASASTKVSVRVRRGCIRRRGELHRFAAAAGRGLVRVVEHECRREFVDLEVHLGPEQEQNRLRVNQELHALVLNDLVELRGLLGIFHRIG